ncbi:villin-3-like isoform X2 [Macadamia integrifolia]|uniref:villin-3-like isoform X2 n=1 Tax=Macadamia integrifolia TaxID=60698 RepID=UPI001C4FE64C|nr:villin-3-like isoform X2 [Macadamia integrifolia]
MFSLFGASHSSENQDKSNNSNQGGATQRAAALAALNSAFNPSSATKAAASRPSSTSRGSQRAAAVAALSNVLTAEQKKRSPDSSPARAGVKSENANSEVDDSQESPVKEREEGILSISDSNGEESELKQEIQQEMEQDEAQQDENGSKTYSYDQLNTKSTKTPKGIDLKKRESYLSDEEFQTVLGMTKEAFYCLPKWKQDMQKKRVSLF